MCIGNKKIRTKVQCSHFLFILNTFTRQLSLLCDTDEMLTNAETKEAHNSVSHTLFFEPFAFLNKAHEGGDASARSDHDNWVCGLEGQAELRLADVHGHRGLVSVVGWHLVLQPVSGDSFVDPTRLSLVLHHDGTDVDAVGMNLSHKTHKTLQYTQSAPYNAIFFFFYIFFFNDNYCVIN